MKETIIKHLTDLMATVQMAHYKGRLPETIHVGETGVAGISIDLYNFDGDGKPVCDGLTFQREHHEGLQQAFCIVYNPDWEDEQLWVKIDPFDEGNYYDLLPEDLPDGVLTAIATWLEGKMSDVRSKREDVKNDNVQCSIVNVQWKNDVTSFFFYMWNKWNEDECKLVWKDDFYPHFWTKWCYLCNRYGRFGAVEEFFAELSNNNRDELVKRALEVYNGMSEK